ncbi:MAG: hypothetical protein AVDCRST_MAG50-1369, partial [uncultured Acidimicrobiales bacterium]
EPSRQRVRGTGEDQPLLRPHAVRPRRGCGGLRDARARRGHRRRCDRPAVRAQVKRRRSPRDPGGRRVGHHHRGRHRLLGVAPGHPAGVEPVLTPSRPQPVPRPVQPTGDGPVGRHLHLLPHGAAGGAGTPGRGHRAGHPQPRSGDVGGARCRVDPRHRRLHRPQRPHARCQPDPEQRHGRDGGTDRAHLAGSRCRWRRRLRHVPTSGTGPHGRLLSTGLAAAAEQRAAPRARARRRNRAHRDGSRPLRGEGCTALHGVARPGGPGRHPRAGRRLGAGGEGTHDAAGPELWHPPARRRRAHRTVSGRQRPHDCPGSDLPPGRGPARGAGAGSSGPGRARRRRAAPPAPGRPLPRDAGRIGLRRDPADGDGHADGLHLPVRSAPTPAGRRERRRPVAARLTPARPSRPRAGRRRARRPPARGPPAGPCRVRAPLRGRRVVAL